MQKAQIDFSIKRLIISKLMKSLSFSVVQIKKQSPNNILKQITSHQHIYENISEAFIYKSFKNNTLCFASSILFKRTTEYSIVISGIKNVQEKTTNVANMWRFANSTD